MNYINDLKEIQLGRQKMIIHNNNLEIYDRVLSYYPQLIDDEEWYNNIDPIDAALLLSQTRNPDKTADFIMRRFCDIDFEVLLSSKEFEMPLTNKQLLMKLFEEKIIDEDLLFAYFVAAGPIPEEYHDYIDIAFFSKENWFDVLTILQSIGIIISDTYIENHIKSLPTSDIMCVLDAYIHGNMFNFSIDMVLWLIAQKFTLHRLWLCNSIIDKVGHEDIFECFCTTALTYKVNMYKLDYDANQLMYVLNNKILTDKVEVIKMVIESKKLCQYIKPILSYMRMTSFDLSEFIDQRNFKLVQMLAEFGSQVNNFIYTRGLFDTDLFTVYDIKNKVIYYKGERCSLDYWKMIPEINRYLSIQQPTEFSEFSSDALVIRNFYHFVRCHI